MKNFVLRRGCSAQNSAKWVLLSNLLPWWKPGFLRRFFPDYGTSRSTSPDLDLSRCVIYRYLSCHWTPLGARTKIAKSMWKPGRTKGWAVVAYSTRPENKSWDNGRNNNPPHITHHDNHHTYQWPLIFSNLNPNLKNLPFSPTVATTTVLRPLY